MILNCEYVAIKASSRLFLTVALRTPSGFTRMKIRKTTYPGRWLSLHVLGAGLRIQWRYYRTW